MAFEILVKLLGDGSGFNRMLGGAKKAAGSFAGSLKSQLAGAFSVGALTLAAKANIDYADSLDDMSKKLGVGTTKLQEWDYAAKLSGASLTDFAAAVKGLSAARADALSNPGGERMSLFRLLGIDERALADKSISDLMEAVAAALQSKSFGAGEANLVTQILGKGGMALLPTIKSGLAEAGQEAQRLGIVLGEDVVKQLADAADSITKMGVQFTRAFAAPLAAALRTILEIKEAAKSAISPYAVGFFAYTDEYSSGVKSGLSRNEANKRAKVAQAIAYSQAKGEIDQAWYDARKRAAEAAAMNGPADDPNRGGDLPAAEARKAVVRAAVQRRAAEEGFTAASDSLSRVGGFTGASGNPQIDAMKRSLEQSNRTLQEMNRNIAALEKTVSGFARSEF